MGVHIMHCKMIMRNILLQLGVILATIILQGIWAKLQRQLYWGGYARAPLLGRLYWCSSAWVALLGQLC